MIKLFIGAIYNPNIVTLEIIQEKLSSSYGEIDSISPVFSYDHSTYYNKEMGETLCKIFFSFRDLYHIEKLPAIKRHTNELELEFFSQNGKERFVNLDPGLMTLGKLILMTTKDQQHRVYLEKGIFAELTYYYRAKLWHPFPWAYPDYLRQDYLDFFLELRKKYHAQLTP